MDRDGEPDQDDIARAYPGWETWKGVDRMCHALRKTGAALTARGEDWMDLLDQIRRAEAIRPAAWENEA